MKKKNIIACTLILSMLLGVCSCNKEPAESVTDTSEPTESTIPTDIYGYISEDSRFIDPENGDDLDAQIEEAIAHLERAVLVRNGHGFLDRNYLNTLNYGSFWVKSYSYFDYEAGENVYTAYMFDYGDLLYDDLIAMTDAIDSEVASIIAAVPATAGDTYNKVLAVHDELIDRTTFEAAPQSEDSANIYGALVGHSATSAGYALAMRQILRAMDIGSEAVLSDIHSWIRVEDDYGDVFIDTGRDDSTNADSQGRPYRNYDYFGLTEPEVRTLDPNAVFLPGEGGREGFNYYAHEGMILSSFDSASITDLFAGQVAAGSNTLTVRFDNEDAYNEALDYFTDTTRTWNILHGAGILGADCWKIHNDDVMTFTVGIDELIVETAEETEESEA